MSHRATRRSIRAAAMSAGLLGVLGVAACSTSGAQGVGPGGYPEGDSVAIYPAGTRPLVGDISGPLLGGGTLNLATDRGKVVVLNTWSSWCGPCRDEAAGLDAAAKALPDAAFVGIDTRDDQSSALAFVQAHDVTYPSFFDEDGSLLLVLQRAVAVNSQPTTIVLDTNGRVAARISGPVDATTLEEIVHTVERGG